MEEDLPDYTMSLPFPTLPEEPPEALAARIEAALAEFQKQQRDKREPG